MYIVSAKDGSRSYLVEDTDRSLSHRKSVKGFSAKSRFAEGLNPLELVPTAARNAKMGADIFNSKGSAPLISLQSRILVTPHMAIGILLSSGTVSKIGVNDSVSVQRMSKSGATLASCGEHHLIAAELIKVPARLARNGASVYAANGKHLGFIFGKSSN